MQGAAVSTPPGAAASICACRDSVQVVAAVAASAECARSPIIPIPRRAAASMPRSTATRARGRLTPAMIGAIVVNRRSSRLTASNPFQRGCTTWRRWACRRADLYRWDPGRTWPGLRQQSEGPALASSAEAMFFGYSVKWTRHRAPCFYGHGFGVLATPRSLLCTLDLFLVFWCDSRVGDVPFTTLARVAAGRRVGGLEEPEPQPTRHRHHVTSRVQPLCAYPYPGTSLHFLQTLLSISHVSFLFLSNWPPLRTRWAYKPATRARISQRPLRRNFGNSRDDHISHGRSAIAQCAPLPDSFPRSTTSRTRLRKRSYRSSAMALAWSRSASTASSRSLSAATRSSSLSHSAVFSWSRTRSMRQSIG